MKYFLILLSCLIFSANSFAIEFIDVNEEMISTTIREQVCEAVYFDYYDYGEMFDGDNDGSEFKSLCAEQSITVTQKIRDEFPAGKTPEDFDDKITTKLIFDFVGENEECRGYAVRSLPTSGFRISDDGEILTVANKGNTWSVEIIDCQ